MVRFCPKCGKWLRPDSKICPKCGFILLEDKNMFLDFMENLILKEKLNEKRKVIKDKVPGEIININEDIITIECKFAKFEEGDIIGYVTPENLIEPIGIVIGGGKTLTVSLYKPLELQEGKILDLCETEILVGYDLQLELIERIKNGILNEFEKAAISCIFEENNLKAKYLERNKLQDKKDIKDGFSLDDSQIEAIEAILGLKDKEIMLIIGPPGTGKTRVIAKAAFELTKKGERVLITSHTNRAVDNAIEILPIDIALRVGRPEKILPSIRKYLLSYKARTSLGKELENIENEISKKRKEIRDLNYIRDEYAKLKNWEKIMNIKKEISNAQNRLRELCEERNIMLINESKKLIKEATIIGSTLIKSQLPPLKDEFFDTVLIDECSQASITLALLGMIKAKKWVLVGDHKQLLPIFQTIDIEDKRILENLSIFCYMLKKYKNRSLWLKWHYRSNDQIIGFSQKYIYNGNITPIEACKNIKLNFKNYPKNMAFLDPEKPVIFLHVNGTEIIEKDGSRFNEKEVETIENIVYALKNLGIKSNEIGIITPFRAQRNKIKEILKDEEIEVSTVDAFQGREKDVIIFSITSTINMDFVEDENRLNVAFTRARKKLIVIGNAKSVKQTNYLYKFLNYAKERNGYFNV